MSRSEICDDSLVLAAVCCWTLTSAASAKCISVFLSGLSSKFLQPMHLQMDEHMIFAFEVKGGKIVNSLFRHYEVRKIKNDNVVWGGKLPRSTRSSSSGSLIVCSCNLYCVAGLILPLYLYQF